MLHVYYLFLFFQRRVKGHEKVVIDLTPAQIAQVKHRLGCYQAPTIKRRFVDDVRVANGNATEPKPFIAQSMIHMVTELQRWMDSHPDERPPASSRFDRSTVRERFAKETIFLAEPDEIAWIFRVQVPRKKAPVKPQDFWMVPILRLSDGRSMLVRVQEFKGQWITHTAWTGAQDFSTSAVAVSCGPILSKSVFYDKLNVSLDELFDTDANLIRASLETAKDPNTYYSDTSRASSHETALFVSDVLSNGSTTPKDTSRAASPAGGRRSGRQKKRQFSSMSSGSITKRARTSAPGGFVGDRHATKATVFPRSDQTIARPIKVVRIDPAARRRLSQYSELSQPGISTGKSRSRGIDNAIIVLDPRANALTLSGSFTTSLSPAEHVETPSSQRLVRFRFFRANENLGAISKSLDDCSNAGKFFDFADRVSRLDPQCSQPFAVSTTFPGKAYPTMVEWRDQQGYEDMIDEITQGTVIGHRLDVEIRIVRE